jgi:hypothetical protein
MEGGTSMLVVESHGVTIEIAVDEPTLLPSVEAVLPPGWQEGDPAKVTDRLALTRDGQVSVDGATVRVRDDRRTALSALDSALHSVVAQNAPDRVFIHAGVVAGAGRAIVLPGPSWSGKTTLVAALVRAGATYFSDEFAVLDSRGRVHPYPKPLSLREPPAYAQVDVPPEELGAVGSAPAEVTVIAVTRFSAENELALRRGSAGGGALALLSHAVAARARSAAVLEAVRAAATGAVYLEGTRGEAEPAAQALLSLIDPPGATTRDPLAFATPSESGA